MSESTKPKGIKQIAQAVGVSIGTVDRALHGRPGVSAKTRDRIMKVAEQFNYSPNIAARNLKLNRSIKVGVYLPKQIACYYDVLRDGIRKASGFETAVPVLPKFFEYPRLGEGDVELMRQTDWSRFDGLILAPGHPARMRDISAEAAELGKPVVFVTTDAPFLHHLACIRTDSFVSGALAAELLSGWIKEASDVVMFTGDLEVEDHSEKLRGFADHLAASAPHLKLASTVESHDSFDEAYTAAVQIFKECAGVRGVYVNTSNSLPVLQALGKLGLLNRVRTITTDLFPELVPYLENGQVSASLYQRPFAQGRMAVEALIGFLAHGQKPPLATRLAPHIILRSNLSLFIERMDPARQ